MNIYALNLGMKLNVKSWLKIAFMPWEKYIAQQQLGTRRWKGERGSGIVSLTVSRSIGTHGESKAFEESATYEANEDEPSFEQRDFHECPWGGRKRHREGGGRAKGRAKSHDERKTRGRGRRLLQDGWMGLLATWCEGCPGEVELPAIVARLIIVLERIWNKISNNGGRIVNAYRNSKV